MTTGVLLFSFNNDHTDYTALTKRCIKHIKEHLKLPITVVGDTEFDVEKNIIIDPVSGNRRIYKDTSVDWFNLERSSAYDYSPYDITILMDTDYFVLSDRLLYLASTCNDILLHDSVYDITGQDNLFQRSDCVIPMVWATVIIFKKNDLVRSIFDMVKHVQQHYQHYRNMYRLKPRSYRNDYAFAIALHQVFGQHRQRYCLPTPMFMMGKNSSVIDLTSNSLIYRINSERYAHRYAVLPDHDVHIFDKEFSA